MPAQTTSLINLSTFCRLFLFPINPQISRAHVDDDLLQEARDSVNKGMALGNDRFKDEIEALCSQRARPAKIGRPRKKARLKYRLKKSSAPHLFITVFNTKQRKSYVKN